MKALPYWDIFVFFIVFFIVIFVWTNTIRSDSKMPQSVLLLISVLAVGFNFFTCVLESEFWTHFIIQNFKYPRHCYPSTALWYVIRTKSGNKYIYRWIWGLSEFWKCGSQYAFLQLHFKWLGRKLCVFVCIFGIF